jgi:hypothetical protein
MSKVAVLKHNFRFAIKIARKSFSRMALKGKFYIRRRFTADLGPQKFLMAI